MNAPCNTCCGNGEVITDWEAYMEGRDGEALANCPDCDGTGYIDDDPPCTDCGGVGITYQTERKCACQP